jgi:2-polyprenyl-3-methyl-5-hydroxy-6-metoxy-1,4-benzoquinol methylase
MNPDTYEGYRKDAEELITRFEGISSEDVLAPAIPFLGNPPARVIDIGAGTGRDAAWLASRGFDVTAVEPVEELRLRGMRQHPFERIEWVADSLPHLSALAHRDGHFNLVLLVGVWQHVAPENRRAAMRSLRRLVKVSGQLIMSVRHGSGASSRPCFESSDAETIGLAGGSGFDLIGKCPADSIQQGNRDAGVTWTWLSFVAVEVDRDEPQGHP